MKLKNYLLLPSLALIAFSSCNKNSNQTPTNTKPDLTSNVKERPVYCGSLMVYGDPSQQPSEPQGYKFPIIAGQNINVGWATIGQANGQYHVTIDITLGDWYVKEAHVNFWAIPAGETSPSSNYGNPAPGQFPCHWYGASPYNDKEATIDIPTSVWPYNPFQQVNVAVHCVVMKKNANGSTNQTQTGWAGPGTRFTTKGNWATYLWCLQFWPCI